MKTKIFKFTWSKVLVKNIVSYLALLLIPLLTITIIFWMYFFGIIKDSILSEYKTTLDYTSSTMDSNFLQLKNNALNITTNPKLSRYAINASVINQREAITELNNSILQNKLISKIALYYLDMPLIYTNSGTLFPQTFAKLNILYDMEGSNFVEWLLQINRSALYCTSIGNDNFQVLYVVPLPVDTLQPRGWAIYILSGNSIKEPIIQMIKKYNSVTLIFDSNNNLLTRIGDNTDVSGINIDGLSINKTNNNVLTLGDTEYLYAYASTNMNFLSYLTLIPYDIAMADVNILRNFIFYGIAVFIVLGTILIVALGRKHYTPIKKLKDFSANLLGIFSDHENDFEIIHDSIKLLHERDVATQSILSYNSPALRSYLLKKLLLGSFKSREEFNEVASPIGLTFNQDGFRVIVFAVDYVNDMEIPPTDSLIESVENMFKEKFTVYGTDTLANNSVIFIVSINLDDDKVLLNLASKIRNEIEKCYNANIGSGIGGFSRNITDIPKSYIESLIATDWSVANSINSVSYYEKIDFVNATEINRTINKELNNIEHILRSGDSKRMISFLNEIQMMIISHNNSALAIRHFCYSIYYIVMQTASCKGNVLKLITKDYMEALIFCNTTDRFFDLLKKLCLEICAEFSIQLESHNVQLSKVAIEYINARYTSPDFSVSVMAEELEVNSSYLSRYFKDQTGKTITEYLIDKRIKKAKELLSTTDYPIKEIIKKIGYQNETSFVRTFKRIEGITPGVYRNKMFADFE